jgi:hypothetical protein
MSRTRVSRRHLAAFCALSLLSTASCARSQDSGSVLGTLHVGPGAGAPEDGHVPKVLIVRGRRIAGEQKVTYRGGRSYVGDVCLQPVPPTSEDDAWPPGATPDPRRLSGEARARILRVPLVATPIARGASPDSAIAEYCALEDRMLAAAATAYHDNRCHGLAEADRCARAKLDPALADTARAGRNPPRFGPGRFVSVHFVGTGYRTLMPPAGWVERDGADQSISLRFASNSFEVLRMSMESNLPTVVIVSTMGPAVYVSDQATEVLREIDELTATGAVAPRAGGALVPQGPVLDPEVRDEILAYARGHQGDL